MHSNVNYNTNKHISKEEYIHVDAILKETCKCKCVCMYRRYCKPRALVPAGPYPPPYAPKTHLRALSGDFASLYLGRAFTLC